MYCGICGVEDNNNVIKRVIEEDGHKIYVSYYGRCSECGELLGEKETYLLRDTDYIPRKEVKEIVEKEEEKKEKIKKSKLIIHETDCHGCGFVYYNGSGWHYSYDDGEFGDIATSVQALINIGFINPEDVEMFSDTEIYEYIEDKMEEE